MNDCEMTVSFNESSVPVFLQTGFFNLKFITQSIHKHRYSEIHILCKGSMRYFCGGEYYSLSEGEVLVIPPDMFHKCTFKSDDTEKVAFQAAYPISEVMRTELSREVLKLLVSAIQESTQTKNGARLSAILSLLLTDIFNKAELELRPIAERPFIIYEFFANEYVNDVTIDDIAKRLAVSSKQAERLVLKYTGNTFRKELTRRRIEAARHMIEMEHLSMSEAAARVGYKSYSGFWKSFYSEKY